MRKPPSEFDRIVSHQQACTAKLQEQITILIARQDQIHHQLVAWHRFHEVHDHGGGLLKSHSDYAHHHQRADDIDDAAKHQRADDISAHAYDQRHDAKHIKLAGHAESVAVEKKECELSAPDPTEESRKSSVLIVPRASDISQNRSSYGDVEITSQSPNTMDKISNNRSMKKLNEVQSESFMPIMSLSPGGAQSLATGPQKKPAEQNRTSQASQHLHHLNKMRYSQAENLKRVMMIGDGKDGWMGAAADDVPTRTCWCDEFVRSAYFDHVCAVMLITNSFFIGVQVEHTAQNQVTILPTEYLVVDYLYGFWFIVELILRIRAKGKDFFKNAEERSFNLLDCLIVAATIVEMILPIFSTSGPVKNLSAVRTVRVARVARIARVIRLMRFFRSLRILLAAIFNTVKSCVWTALLLGMILYMFGIVFVQAVTDFRIEQAEKKNLVREDMVYYFGTLPRGIFTVFKSVLGGLDWQTAVEPLSDVDGIYVGLFVLMITFIYLAVINVISGLFLQSAIEQAQSDREAVIQQQIRDRELYMKKALSLFGELDDNLDGQVSLREFERHLNEERMAGFLHALGIDSADAWTLFKLLDADRGGSVTVNEFIDGCLKIRGNAKSVHVAQIMYENKWLMDAVYELTSFLDIQFDSIQEQLSAISHLRRALPSASAPPVLEEVTPMQPDRRMVPEISKPMAAMYTPPGCPASDPPFLVTTEPDDPNLVTEISEIFPASDPTFPVDAQFDMQNLQVTPF